MGASHLMARWPMLGVCGGSSRETGASSQVAAGASAGMCVVSNQALGMDGGRHRKVTSEGTWACLSTGWPLGYTF